MNLNEDKLIHTGLFGVDVPKIFRAVYCHASRNWKYNESCFRTLPNGEFVYYTGDNKYSQPFDGVKERNAVKRAIGTLLLNGIKVIAWRNFRIDSWKIGSPAKMRENNDTLLDAKFFEFDGVKFTFKEVAFLIEFFWGYKEVKNFEKCYDKDVLDRMKGKERNPFLANAIDCFETQVIDLQKEAEQKDAEFYSEYLTKKKTMRAEYDARIEEIKAQMAELKKQIEQAAE